MDVGVSNEALDGIPIEESDDSEVEEEEVIEGEDPDLVRYNAASPPFNPPPPEC